jgi:hypothetical protein
MLFAALIIFLFHPFLGAQIVSRAESPQPLSHEELAQMLAPIALYPDALLSQVLIASSYPFEVVEAERWLANNPHLTGIALDDALWEKPWDVSVLSLCHYPKILTMMTENLSWTARLGDAFIHQEREIMDTVQELRAQARARGALATTWEQAVIEEGNVIRIVPADDNYLYIPAYDPYYVYGTWRYPAYPPFTIYYSGVALRGARVVFSPGFYIGFGFFGWSSFNWTNRHIVVVPSERFKRYDRHFHGYKVTPSVRWRPDEQRRLESRKRGPDVPPYRPPARPLMRVQERDVKTGRGDVPPSGSTPQPAGPRVIERRPDMGRRIPEKAPPPQAKQPLFNQGAPVLPVPSSPQKPQPTQNQPAPMGPRVIDGQSETGPRLPARIAPPQSSANSVAEPGKPSVPAPRTVKKASRPEMKEGGAALIGQGENPQDRKFPRAEQDGAKGDRPRR